MSIPFLGAFDSGKLRVLAYLPIRIAAASERIIAPTVYGRTSVVLRRDSRQNRFDLTQEFGRLTSRGSCSYCICQSATRVANENAGGARLCARRLPSCLVSCIRIGVTQPNEIQCRLLN
jgi:hypothetical protein